MKKSSREVSSISRLFLYRKFWTLYLVSRRARWRFFIIAISKKPKKHTSSSLVGDFKHDLNFAYKNSWRWLKAANVLLLISAICVVIQLSYPENRTLPFARLQANGYVGMKTKPEILSKFSDFNKRLVTVHTHSKNFTTNYGDLGVKIKPEETFNSLKNYSLRQRLIPFSIFIVGNSTHSIQRELDQSQLNLYVNDVIPEVSKDYIDAKISLNGTKLSVTSSEDGYKYQKSTLESQIWNSGLKDREQLIFSPTVLKPAINTDTAENQAKAMQERINNPLVVRAEDRSTIVNSKTIASWLEIKPNFKNNKFDLIFDKKLISDSVRPFVSSVNKPPVQTVITTLNGLEAGRKLGINGTTVEFDDLINQIANATSGATATIEAKVEHPLPGEVYDRRYTKDSLGMQNLLNFWTANHQGRYGIDFRSLSGNISANINPYGEFPAYGISRLFLAHTVYGRITAGSIDGESMTSAGWSVNACIDRMVYAADENCAQALGDMVGWSSNDYLLHAQGFESTSLSSGSGSTTANDAADWMIKLLGRQITSYQQKNALLNMLGRQIFRNGIPTGSPGISVQDKSGSAGSITNDAAIVYNPGGTYILSVLSEGAGFSDIADLTHEINKVMNQ